MEFEAEIDFITLIEDTVFRLIENRPQMDTCKTVNARCEEKENPKSKLHSLNL